MDKLNEQQNERLAQAGQAAVNMSHGIKNIIQSIHSGSDVLDKALEIGDTDRAKRAWGIIKDNLERIQKLSLDMLKFSKDEDLNIKPCDLKVLIKATVEAFRAQADKKQIDIILKVDKQLELMEIDRDKIQDVIMNLLINAIEAVEPKTGQIIVEVKLDKNSQQVTLSTSDNGPGIEDTNIIFEPFHSTKDNIGAGLGLTIARKVIEKHGGTLLAQSQPQGGTTFTARIPVNTKQE